MIEVHEYPHRMYYVVTICYVCVVHCIFFVQLSFMFWARNKLLLCGRDSERCDSVGEICRMEGADSRSAEHAHHLRLLQDVGDHDRRNYVYVAQMSFQVNYVLAFLV